MGACTEEAEQFVKDRFRALEKDCISSVLGLTEGNKSFGGKGPSGPVEVDKEISGPGWSCGGLPGMGMADVSYSP